MRDPPEEGDSGVPHVTRFFYGAPRANRLGWPENVGQYREDEFRAASLKLLIGGPTQASGPINNFALNSSRVGLELKGACHMTKALAKVM